MRFQNLFVNAEVYVGSRALPTLINFTRNILEVNCFPLLISSVHVVVAVAVAVALLLLLLFLD